VVEENHPEAVVVEAVEAEAHQETQDKGDNQEDKE
jgi:hypothetical protein